MAGNRWIPQTEFQRRLEGTQQRMKQRNLDGLIAFSSFQEREGHVFYLTNHHIAYPNALTHVGLGHSAYVLPAEGLGDLISPFGYEAEKVVNIDQARTGFSLVPDILVAVREKGLAGKKIGIVGSDVIPAEYLDGLKKALGPTSFEVANDLLEDQRRIKSPAEIALLRRSAEIADASLRAGLEAATEGVAGHQVELEMRKAALQAGADFIPRVRVSIGPKIQALNWPMSTDRRIQRGDLIYLDIIGWAAGYGFDNSRVKVAGEPTKEQRGYLNHVVEATANLIALLRPGAQLDCQWIRAGERQVLSYGHGIGLEIAEPPLLLPGLPKITIEADMVLCIEPIVLDPQFGGICVEDTVLVAAGGAEVFNRCPRVFW